MAAKPCRACENGRHTDCGGPESGCGCAADSHGTVQYEINVTLKVQAPPKSAKDVEETVMNYLGDFIPDEGPNDAIHIHGYTVWSAKRVKPDAREGS